MPHALAALPLEALARLVPCLSLVDAPGGARQANLVCRGHTLSPLQGAAQGLAANLDGARSNTAFGDTARFDLLPDAAIERTELLHARPADGLNALGGALAVTTKSGRRTPGLFADAAGASCGERTTTLEAGGARAAWSACGAVGPSASAAGGGSRRDRTAQRGAHAALPRGRRRAPLTTRSVR